jgi:hypothetical protein
MYKKATLTAVEAVSILNSAGMSISVKTLRDGIEQGVFPFGICVLSDSRIFYISKKKLAEFIEDFCGVSIEID